jgi:hypothetical protein
VRATERQEAARSEHPGRLGDRSIGIGEGERSVVGEDHIEGRVAERNPLRTGVHQPNHHIVLRDQPPGVRELGPREVQPHGPGRPPRQGDGPLCGPASELEDVLARHVVQDMKA